MTRQLARVPVVLALLAGAALVQAQPPSETPEPRERAPAAAPDPLGGPRIDDRAGHSLIRRDMGGRLVRIQGRPERAALDLVEIDPDRRAAAISEIEARDRELRAHLVARIDLVKESTDAQRAGDRAKVQRFAQELHQSFDPDQQRDPLLDRLRAVLAPKEHAELTRIVHEYWDAWLDQEQRPGQFRVDVEARLASTLFQEEIRQAYEVTLRPLQQKLERIFEAVDPTPEQREAIRGALIAYVRANGLQSNPDERLRLARAINEALDEDRRLRLLAAALSSL
ncbi:MAG: hypothetical protein AB7K52_15030 [Phycisphaerales bacterium]